MSVSVLLLHTNAVYFVRFESAGRPVSAELRKEGETLLKDMPFDESATGKSI